MDIGLAGTQSTGLAGYYRELLVSRIERAVKMRDFSEVPQDVCEKVLRGELKLQPHQIYARKVVGLATGSTKIFDRAGSKVLGVTNVKDSQLERGEFALLFGVSVNTAELAGVTDTDIKAGNYRGLETTAAHREIANGELMLKLGGKNVFNELSMVSFKTAANQCVNSGFLELETPRIIKEENKIECELTPASATLLTPNTAIEVVLWTIKTAA
jgi:hypothetical protein